MGAWYDPSDLSSMFQDSSGTTPVTGAGDPVGRINDKSGNGFHATQATTANKPTLRLDGSRYYLEFDRVNDGLSTADSIDLSGTSKVTLCVGIQTSGVAAAGNVMEFSVTESTAGAFYITQPLSVAGQIRMGGTGSSSGSYRLDGSSTPYKAVCHVLLDTAGASIAAEVFARVNAAAVSTNATGTLGTGNFGNHRLFIGTRNDTGVRFGGRIYGIVVRGATASADDRDDLEAFMNTKTGAY